MSSNYKTPSSASHILFSFAGRINRKTYWLATGLTLWAVICISILLDYVSMSDGIMRVMLFLMRIAFLAIQCIRLHDFNASGWWLLVSLPGYPTVIPEFTASFPDSEVIYWVLNLGTYALLIVCGFVKRTQGENRFGL